MPYSATKGGLVMFVRNAAMDLARHRIRINAVDPGDHRHAGCPPR